jgi:hypothetical protein
MPPAPTTQYTPPIDNPVTPLYSAAGGWRTINANVPGSYDVQNAGYDAPYAGPPGTVPVVVVPPARPAPPSYVTTPTYPVHGQPAGSPAASGEDPGPAATWGTRPLIVRTLEPRPRSDAPPFPGVPYNPSATPAGRDLAASHNTTPPPDDGGLASNQRGLEPAPVEIRRVPAEPPDGSRVVVATATETPGGGPRQAVTTPRDYYAHDPGYQWLRGRLEYSQVEGHWRLRYIPMAGAMDDFGGSVIIANPAALAGLERGEWVEVRGQPGHADRTGAAGRQMAVATTKIRSLGDPQGVV